MAQSIALFFHEATWPDLRKVLNSVAKGFPDDNWHYPIDENYVSVYSYDNLLDEFEDEDLDDLLRYFADLPSAILAIEYHSSQGMKTCEAAAQLTELLFRQFSGVADDLYDQFWTDHEILDGVRKSTGTFVESVRYPKSVEEWEARWKEIRAERRRHK